MFDQHTALESLGIGTLIVRQKPKKPLGPPSSLRTIVLLNSTRKVISLVALHHIQEKVNTFTGASQGGFKQGRSSADLVWAQRTLIATVQCRQWDFHKMGIDMSRGFDTIKRGKALCVILLLALKRRLTHLGVITEHTKFELFSWHYKLGAATVPLESYDRVSRVHARVTYAYTCE